MDNPHNYLYTAKLCTSYPHYPQSGMCISPPPGTVELSAIYGVYCVTVIKYVSYSEVHMNRLTLHTGYDCRNTVVSNLFIDRYMASANGEFVKIYLYLLRCVTDQQITISVTAVADFFNQTEADVCRALKYWDKQGVIEITMDSAGKDITDITFNDLSELADSSEADIPVNMSEDDTYDMSLTASVKTSDNAGDFNTVDFALTREPKPAVETRTAYTPKQINALKASSDDFSMMLYGVSTLLGGTLSASDMSTLAYFYDTLHFSAELIEYLIEYCATNGHKSFRYIEKVALAWADKGITTVKQAKTSNMNYNDTTYSVLEAFGITNRSAGKVELDYINKWNEMYRNNNSIIIEACNRTMKATHQPSFEYADTILTKWKEADVKNTDDIKEIDALYERSQAEKKRTTASKNSGSNRFNNFQQRDIDMDSLEKALLRNSGLIGE